MKTTTTTATTTTKQQQQQQQQQQHQQQWQHQSVASEAGLKLHCMFSEHYGMCFDRMHRFAKAELLSVEIIRKKHSVNS